MDKFVSLIVCMWVWSVFTVSNSCSMDLGCLLLRGSSDRRLRRRAATTPEMIVLQNQDHSYRWNHHCGSGFKFSGWPSSNCQSSVYEFMHFASYFLTESTTFFRWNPERPGHKWLSDIRNLRHYKPYILGCFNFRKKWDILQSCSIQKTRSESSAGPEYHRAS